MKAWLGHTEPPTAVLCGGDRLALRVRAAAREQGLRVPEDLSVVGYGDSPAAEYLGLTTVRLPLNSLGERLVQLLIDQVRGSDSEPVRIRLAGELMIRRTCSAPSPGTAIPPAIDACQAWSGAGFTLR